MEEKYEYPGLMPASALVDVSPLVESINAANLGATCLRIDLDDGDGVVVMDGAVSKDDLDAVVNSHGEKALEDARYEKSMAIDARTGELIVDGGFQYPPGTGEIYSLSREAQQLLIGCNSAHLEPEFTWPLTWNSKDDSYVLTINNAAEWRPFYLTAVGTVRSHRDSGTALKDMVRAANSVLAVEAVVDNR